MSKTKDREKMVADINLAAKMYKNSLVGRRFLYVFEGKYMFIA